MYVSKFIGMFEVFAVSCVVVLSNVTSKEEKRILLNDATLVDQRLTHLESLVQQQQTSLQQQQTSLQQQQASSQKQESVIQQQQALLQQQQTKITTLENQLLKYANQGVGAIFTRWGKNSCPNNTETVYSGYAGGGYFNNKGAPSNYICLPNNPTNGPAAGTGSISYVWGVEYDTNFWKFDSHDEDAPCAVCRSPQHTSALMIPGRDKCYPGWTPQYTGHLAASHYGHPSGRNYVCVDKDPDYLVGGEGRDTNGALFFPVITVCGTLPCPPYKASRTVLCAVCTK